MTCNNKTINIIIDTNIWISFLIGKSLKGLHRYLHNERIKIVVCKEQIREIKEVVQRPKLSKYFPQKQVSEMFDLLDEVAILVAVASKITLCRDKKDDYLLSLAVDANADYLITGDKDLLAIKTIHQTSIINYSDFEAIINKLKT
jgi:putative PIN family toxin of toxin-antitoxin system